MVYVNSKKFACESCIKGHRSSSCHHTDRPLFEIKKKGRPVSQCTKCRELRQSKKFHSKCTCNHGVEVQAVQPLSSSSNSKTRRFIPIVPALPNGLKDVLTASRTPMQPSDSRQRVDSLLNPCDCKSLWKCKCRESSRTALSVSRSQRPDRTDSLVALATAAASMGCCSPSSSSVAASSSPPLRDSALREYSPRTRSRPESPSSQNSSKKRAKPNPNPQTSPGPNLAPLLYLYSQSSSSITTQMPEFASMPPMSEITSLAGSGCTCGVKCACPGCVEHRAPTEAAQERKDCADGCGACIDSTIGAALPNLSGDSQSSGVSFLDQFFARAAALPPPPVHRMSFDPMDTTVYSHTVGSRSFGFGTVNLPKLECCGGQCNCPGGRCTCHNSCAGCCVDSSQAKQSVDETLRNDVPRGHTGARELPRSCCA